MRNETVKVKEKSIKMISQMRTRFGKSGQNAIKASEIYMQHVEYNISTYLSQSGH